MTNELSLINKTEKMIDEIKSLCAEYGLSGTPGEYKIIIEMFLYKYLNDKFLFVVREKSKDLSNTDSLSDVEEYLNRIDNIEYSKLLIKLGPNVAKFRKEYLASYLFNNQNSKLPEFYELFDNALEGISNDNIDIFVKLENGLSGLVHVSQISRTRVKTPADVLNTGDAVKVKVIGVKDGKISLSMKALEEAPEREPVEKVVIPKAENIGTSLGDLFKNIKL